MNQAAELFAAIRILQGDPAPEPPPVRLPPTMPDVYAKPIRAWLGNAWEQLAAVGEAADTQGVDPLILVDEPDSVRCALAVARAIRGPVESAEEQASEGLTTTQAAP